MSVRKDLGAATAYGYAVEKGYTGTEEEFAELMADYAAVGQRAEQAATLAAASATSASGSASDSAASATAAEGSATAAATSAGNASQSAQNASQSASAASGSATAAGQSATAAAGSATTAGNKASEAAQSATEAAASATVAGTAATNAQTAQTAAEAAQTAAETAQDAAETAATSVAGKTEQIDQNTADISLIKSQLEAKANTDGYYSDMTVGNAEQLVATVGIEDKVPYIFRTSGGTADIGDREVDTLIGGTVAWNQLTREMTAENWTGSNTVFQDGVGEMTASSQYGQLIQFQAKSPDLYKGHKYLVSFSAKVSGGSNLFRVYNVSGTHFMNSQFGTSYAQYGAIAEQINNARECRLVFQNNAASDFATLYVKGVCLFDLTQMFGTTIADYIYSLETAHAGDGVAWFRKLFPKDYYAYDPGSLQSVNASSHDMTGFNQWDEEYQTGYWNILNGIHVNNANEICSKNRIRVVPGAVYYFKRSGVGSSGDILFYDSEDVYIRGLAAKANSLFTIPENCTYMRFNAGNAYGKVYNNDICINISWDGERDGEYEPYEKHSYPLDSSLTLRGIPKLDANNQLYYDGDTYESDGTVTRRYGIVDLGTLEWSYSSYDYMYALISDIKVGTNSDMPNIVCPKFLAVPYIERTNYSTPIIDVRNQAQYVEIRGSGYSDGVTFKTAMSGVYLVYELATPTTETADPYQNPQIVDDFGTEEYVTTSIVPVGHETQYQVNLRAKLEMAPDSPDGDGDYIVRQTDGENTYVPLVIPEELPTKPTENGTYVLKVTVSGGTPTLAWVAE